MVKHPVIHLEPDGLTVMQVGEWATEKHELLHHYVTITAAVRRKFLGPGKAGATYVELFSGPGRCMIRGQNRLIPGSNIVAIKAATTSNSMFSAVHLNDMDGTTVASLRARIEQSFPTARVSYSHLDAADASLQLGKSLNSFGYHFVFLDPFNLATLPPALISSFAHLRHVDLLMHVSAMDLNRNLEQALSVDEGHQFDAFAPGWRSVVDQTQPSNLARRNIREFWVQTIKSMGFHVFSPDEFELIRGTRNQPLYWLALASKNPKAAEFWNKIRNLQPQSNMDF